MQRTGDSALFHFPYRIYAEEKLGNHTVISRDFQCRVHAPFFVNQQASPVTQDVPIHLWPGFAWDPGIHPKIRDADPIAPVEIRLQTPSGEAITYDGFRMDVWAPDARERMSPLVKRFTQWLRHLSAQPWISDVDRHNSATLKRFFPINNQGQAVGEASPFLSFRGASFVFVNDPMWRQALALGSIREVPVYSNLFFDAVNASAVNDYPRAVMNLSMALESCRDINFSRIHPAKSVPGRGPRLKSPFDHTDLLQHLTRDANEAFGRDFSAEYPQHWLDIEKLYHARHQVAHGKGAVYPSDNGLAVVDIKSFAAMQIAGAAALRWMETLSPTQIQPDSD